uniref:Organic solvent tolerance-like N-terminal domain-containing protein n=1 Tax=Panagrolaimus sp. ES5 TaxID=591445 RepID=A0AC34FYD4_9BILA
MSFGLLIASLVGFCLDEEKMISVIQINRSLFSFTDKIAVTTDALYYWLSFFAIKNLVFLGLSVWFFIVAAQFRAYHDDFKKDEKAKKSNQTSGLQIVVNESNNGNQKAKSNMSTTSITNSHGLPITSITSIGGQDIQIKEYSLRVNGQVILKNGQQIFQAVDQIVKVQGQNIRLIGQVIQENGQPFVMNDEIYQYNGEEIIQVNGKVMEMSGGDIRVNGQVFQKNCHDILINGQIIQNKKNMKKKGTTETED